VRKLNRRETRLLIAGIAAAAAAWFLTTSSDVFGLALGVWAALTLFWEIAALAREGKSR
jgi:hypothetical protein